MTAGAKAIAPAAQKSKKGFNMDCLLKTSDVGNRHLFCINDFWLAL
jgi:hypothetical protein